MMTLGALSRILLTYWWRHGRVPALSNPTRFTELVQRRKLIDRDRDMVARSDKLAVKAYVADLLGPAWVTPTLWSGSTLPEAYDLPVPFVLKSRHGCKQIAFVREAGACWVTLRERSRRWMASRYGWWLDEWAYGEIPRGLLVEPFIGPNGALPLDYKFYIFGGRVAYVQVHLDREHGHRWIVLDRAWHPMPAAPPVIPLPPTCLAKMIAGAEALGAAFDFVRVDLYQIGGRPRFGEMSFYPGSGLDAFDPPELDQAMGALWLRAIERRAEADSAPLSARSGNGSA